MSHMQKMHAPVWGRGQQSWCALVISSLGSNGPGTVGSSAPLGGARETSFKLIMAADFLAALSLLPFKLFPPGQDYLLISPSSHPSRNRTILTSWAI